MGQPADLSSMSALFKPMIESAMRMAKPDGKTKKKAEVKTKMKASVKVKHG